MAFYGDEELATLLQGPESDMIERKRNAADGNAIRRNICAFANDLPNARRPGVIIVGLEDDGSCAEIDMSDELNRNLAQIRSDGSIQPIPSMKVGQHTVRGCDVFVIQVAPLANPPVRYQGRVWVRVGSTVQQASPADEQRLIEKRQAGNLTFDLRPVEMASTSDLDIEYAQGTYLPAAISPEVLGQNERTLPQQLRSLRLLAGDHPTQGALIGLGRDPQRWSPGAYVQFVRFAGTTVVDPIQHQKQLTGRIEDVLRQLGETIQINVAVRTDIQTAVREIRQPDYPLAALSQLTHNAIMHRSYEESNAPVRVYWFTDRIEIQSPGGLYGVVTPANINTGVTAYRNPLIAEIMSHLGFAQRFGVGIQIAKAALAANGNPEPDFEFSNERVLVTLRPAP